MRRVRLLALALLVVAFPLPTTRAEESALPRVLFLTHSAGYQHAVVRRPKKDVLSFAEMQLLEAAEGRLEIVATQDVGYLTREKLADFAAVVFYTTGELPIPDKSKAALIDFVKNGGGFVGSHCATDTFYEYAPYGAMIGGYFDGHPWNQKVRVRVENSSHPATKHLGQAFEIHDEIYQFKAWSRDDVDVLLSLDVDSVDLTKKGVKRKDKDFAIAWSRSFGKGRVFYTALGHHAHVWRDPRFQTHLVEGITWATLGKHVDGESTAPGAKPDAEGYVPLLDANHRGTGWRQAGPGRFDVDKHGVATPVGGMGLWYYAAKSYENFSLRLEFKQSAWQSNSGVFIRFPRVDGDPWLPVKEGYEVQIQGAVPTKNNTGSIYTFQAPTRLPLRPPGEWNAMEITAIGQEYSVFINGALCTRYTGSRATKGMIGLQNHQGWKDSVVSFRDVRIKELPADATGLHVLFDGTTRDAWNTWSDSRFRIVDGLLTSGGGHGWIWHTQRFDDFVLTLDWRVEDANDSSGVFLRIPEPKNRMPPAKESGYKVHICDSGGEMCKTGSIFGCQDPSCMPSNPPGDWNHCTIEVRGQRYRVTVNGQLTNDFTGDQALNGHIGLEAHDKDSRVQFRRVRVVTLAKPDSPK